MLCFASKVSKTSPSHLSQIRRYDLAHALKQLICLVKQQIINNVRLYLFRLTYPATRIEIFSRFFLSLLLPIPHPSLDCSQLAHFRHEILVLLVKHTTSAGSCCRLARRGKRRYCRGGAGGRGSRFRCPHPGSRRGSRGEAGLFGLNHRPGVPSDPQRSRHHAGDSLVLLRTGYLDHCGGSLDGGLGILVLGRALCDSLLVARWRTCGMILAFSTAEGTLGKDSLSRQLPCFNRAAFY